MLTFVENNGKAKYPPLTLKNLKLLGKHNLRMMTIYKYKLTKILSHFIPDVSEKYSYCWQ